MDGIGQARRGLAGRGLAALARAVLPDRCPSCGALVVGAALCPACFGTLKFVQGRVCDGCGWPLPGEAGCLRCRPGGPIRRRRFALVYCDAAADLVQRFKYADRPDLAPRLAAWMVRAGGDVLAGGPLLVPVPVHWTRLLRRQYNQSAELARWLSRLTGLTAAPRALERIRATPPQARQTTPEQRKRNVAAAFRVRAGAEISGRTILLIDDVLTTGATAEACAAELMRAGAVAVDLLTIAAAQRPA